MSDSQAATIQVSYEADIDAMLIRIQGHVVLEDYRKAVDSLIVAEGFHLNINTIWDLRMAEMGDLVTGQISRSASLGVLSTEKRGTQWKTAIVVQDDRARGLVRMFEAFANGAPYRMAAFPTVEEAEIWIAGRDKLKI